MAILVNPTHGTHQAQKRLATAIRGHKLPKDKRDEMVRQFMLLIRCNRSAPRVEAALSGRLPARAARVAMTRAMEEALLFPVARGHAQGAANIMSVNAQDKHTERNTSRRSSYGLRPSAG